MEIYTTNVRMQTSAASFSVDTVLCIYVLELSGLLSNDSSMVKCVHSNSTLGHAIHSANEA